MKYLFGLLFIIVLSFKGVSQTPCDPDITYTISPNNPLTYTFTYNGGSGDYFWAFSDSYYTAEMESVITYTFSEPGYYIVYAADMMEPICPDSMYVADTIVVGDVSNLGCTANFHVQTEWGPAAHSSSHPTLQHHWVINGVDYYTRSVSLWEIDDETIDICLMVTDGVACYDTLCQTITNTWNSGETAGYIEGVVYLYDTLAQTVEDMALLTDGTAYLYSVNHSDTSSFGVMVASVPIGNGGVFVFENVPFGVYKVRAALNQTNPDYANYLPGYHYASAYWLEADSLVLNGVISYQYPNILLLPVYFGNGNGNVNGTIIIEDTVRSSVLEDITVSVLDSNTLNGAYDFTDVNGNFSLSGLAYGTYTLTIDKCGYLYPPQEITLSPDNPSIENMQIELVPALTTAVKEQPTLINDVSLYPNPSTENTILQVESTLYTSLTITVFDISGRQLLTQTATLGKGINRINVNTAELPTGVYVVKLTDKNGSVTTKKLMHY